VRRVITRFVEDVVAESGRRIAALAPGHADGIRMAGGPVIAFSPAFAEMDAAIKGFLHPRMYRHPRLLAVRGDADAIVRELFQRFVQEPGAMPEEWQAGLRTADQGKLARRVADYIAGMTDRYALLEHRRLFATTPDLSF
jgi:dGTPase